MGQFWGRLLGLKLSLEVIIVILKFVGRCVTLSNDKGSIVTIA